MTSLLIIIITLAIFFLHEYVNFTIEYKDGKPGLLIKNKDFTECTNTHSK